MSYLTSELEKSGGNLKIQAGEVAKHIRERTILKDFFACCIVTGSHWTVFCTLALRRCPNQQNFDFDVKKWGHF